MITPSPLGTFVATNTSIANECGNPISRKVTHLLQSAMIKFLRATAVLTAIVSLSAFDDESTGPVLVTYVATLNGANERPTANVTSGQVTSGTLDLSTPITNVHNASFPGGEVRGQLIRN